MEPLPEDAAPDHPGDQALDALDRGQSALQRIRDRQLAALQGVHPDGLSLNQLRGRVQGSNGLQRDAVISLVDRGQAEVRRVGRSDHYFWLPPAAGAASGHHTLGRTQPA